MRRHLDHDRPRDECDWDDVVWIYDPMEQMIESLEKLVTGYPPKNQYDGPECKGLYSGPTSIAYLFLQLSRSHPNLQINGFPPEVWLMWYLEGDRTFAAVTLEKNGISSEILAYHAVFAAAGGNDAISSEMLAYHAVLAAAAGKNGFQVFQNFLDLIKAIAQSDKSKHIYIFLFPFSALATTRDSKFVPDSFGFTEKARNVSLIRLCHLNRRLK